MTARTLACAATLCAAGAAFASPEERVVLDVVECERAAEIQRFIAFELGESLARVRATIECTGATVTIRVDAYAAPTATKRIERTLDLATTPIDVQPRVIALAAVELIASRAPARAVPLPMAAATASVIDTQRTTPPRPTMRVGVIASVETFSGTASSLLGGGLRVVRAGPVLDVFVDARVHHGTEHVSIGEVSVTTLDGAAGVSRARRWRELELAIAVGARGGMVWFAGTPNMEVRGETFSAPWWGAFGDASVERAVSSTLRASLGVELGVVALPAGALVGDSREISIDGAWLAARGGLVTTW